MERCPLLPFSPFPPPLPQDDARTPLAGQLLAGFAAFFHPRPVVRSFPPLCARVTSLKKREELRDRAILSTSSSHREVSREPFVVFRLVTGLVTHSNSQYPHRARGRREVAETFSVGRNKEAQEGGWLARSLASSVLNWLEIALDPCREGRQSCATNGCIVACTYA